MYTFIVPAVAAIAAAVFFVLHPLYVYFRDEKRLRKYPAMNWLAGISNIGFMYESATGFRSDRLYKLHKTHPVIRTGPNSLSFAGGQAIKVRLMGGCRRKN